MAEWRLKWLLCVSVSYSTLGEQPLGSTFNSASSVLYTSTGLSGPVIQHCVWTSTHSVTNYTFVEFSSIGFYVGFGRTDKTHSVANDTFDEFSSIGFYGLWEDLNTHCL